MARFKNDKGLTLIELLITIAVLAVVSAIALPVINNVVSSSNSNAAAQTQSDVNDFITKYNAAGETLFASSATTGTVFSGYVDTDGDNQIDSNELVDTLTIDGKFSVSVAGSSDSVGGNYTADGITGATTGLAAAGGSAPVVGGITGLTHTTAFSSQWFGMGTNQTVAFSSYSAATRTLVVTQPRSEHGMCLWDLFIYDSTGGWKGSANKNTTLTVGDDGTTCTYTAAFPAIEADKGITIDPATDIFLVSAGSWNPNAPFTLN